MNANPDMPTERQKRVLDFVSAFSSEHGMPPTVREIADGLGFASTNAVAGHLAVLRRKGLLDRTPRKSRGTRVPSGTMKKAVMMPVLGRIAAGRPILAQENVEDHVAADPFLVRDPENTFVLKVEGDSMNGDGILPGDYIFVRKQSVAERGEIVVALIDDEATIKRYFPLNDGGVRLEASNPSYQPIDIHPESGARLEILGVMTGLYRRI